MDPDELDDLVVDTTYETHGLRATYQPPSSGDPVPDILLVPHQPPQDQPRSASMEFGGALSIAEGFMTMLVRASQLTLPEAEGQFTFVGGKLNGQVYRVGEAPTDHDIQAREWRLKLQKLA